MNERRRAEKRARSITTDVIAIALIAAGARSPHDSHDASSEKETRSIVDPWRRRRETFLASIRIRHVHLDNKTGSAERDSQPARRPGQLAVDGRDEYYCVPRLAPGSQSHGG